MKDDASFKLGSMKDMKVEATDSEQPSYKEDFAKTMDYPSKKVHNNKIPVPVIKEKDDLSPKKKNSLSP